MGHFPSGGGSGSGKPTKFTMTKVTTTRYTWTNPTAGSVLVSVQVFGPVNTSLSWGATLAVTTSVVAAFTDNALTGVSSDANRRTLTAIVPAHGVTTLVVTNVKTFTNTQFFYQPI